MLSVVTVNLLRISSVNRYLGLMDEKDCFPITSEVPKVEKGEVLMSKGDPPKVVLG